MSAPNISFRTAFSAKEHPMARRLWPEFKARVQAAYQAPSRAIARELAAGVEPRRQLDQFVLRRSCGQSSSPFNGF
jgi:hypothetical protein